MNFDVNVVVLVGQLILAGILVWIANKKAPIERQTLDATTAAQYAQAAKLKGEENDKLEKEIQSLEARLQVIERKKYRIVMEFTIGDPPELGKVTIEPLLPEEIPGVDRNTHLKQSHPFSGKK
jgi:glucosamine 6-phosphate synthetase-like amidotransferase/phosphosugar isomerase protein